MLTKKFKQNYHKDWLNQLDIAEAKQDKKWVKYLVNESNSIIEEFLKANKQIPSLEFKFKESDLINLYKELYQEVGNKFAKWYAQNFDKYITKNIDVEYEDIWNEKFAYIGSQVAGARVVSISGNRKKEFVKVLKRYMADPEFQSMNEVQAGRILRKKFKGMSVNNAKRIVRTESTNAANYATNQSATDVFGKENLKKEWIATLDERVRIDHAEANGQVVDMDKNFLVGGEELAYPGDSRGSAANVINCRCTNAPFPKEEIIEESIPERIEPMPVRVPRQTAIQEERPKFYPSEIDELKKLGYELPKDDGYLRNFVKPVNFKLNKNASSNFYRPGENTIYIGLKKAKNNWWTQGDGKRVLVHEIGHSIHNTKKLLYRQGVDHLAHPRFVEKMKDWRDRLLVNKKFDLNNVSEMFQKLDPKGILVLKNSRLAENINRGLSIGTPLDNTRKLFPNIPKEKLNFDWVSTNDFFGAINKMKNYGYGHRRNYYLKSKGNDYAEVFANVYDWKYNGNVIMEKFFPQLYKEALDLLDELLESGEFTPIKL
jgi:hypothetical protein